MFKFFSKNYWLFLVLTVLISYGQILWMQPWEDDNALFFKMAHINEQAGFIGAGVLGEGVYKYGTTPFFLIYKLFGYYVPAYFALALIFYMVATFIVYKVFSEVLNESSGKITSFVYACGYIVSDAFWRLANSVTTSISVIISSLFLMFYFRFYKSGQYKWYLASLVMFTSGLEFALSRMHYFVLVPILIEFIFFTFRKSIKSFAMSIIRLIPFILLFKWKVLGVDARGGGLGDFVGSIFAGKFEVLYGFFASFTNLVIPDWITKFLPKISDYLQLLLIIASVISAILILKKINKPKWLMCVYVIILWLWIYFSYSIFNTPLLQPSKKDLFIVVLGGVLTILSSISLWIKTENSKLFLFFSLWILGGVVAYSFYMPNVAFGTIDRYLAHSFLAFCGLLGVISKKYKYLIIVFALGNLVNGIIFQNNALKTRSFLVQEFYNDLKTNLPVISKGDVLYFDIAPKMQSAFRDATTAAMMPNSTSFAWRYGIDRYDFTYFTEVREFLKFIKEKNIPSDKIHTYFYSESGLHKTVMNNLSKIYEFDTKPITEIGIMGIYIKPDGNIESVVPSTIQFLLSCTKVSSDKLNFPFIYGSDFGVKEKNIDQEFIKKAFDYNYAKSNFKNNFKIEVSSNWQDRTINNLTDGDNNTVWQADRVLWQKANEYILLENKNNQKIANIILMNGFSSYSPSKYIVQISDNKKDWENVLEINNEVRYGDGQLINIPLVNNVSSKYIKILFQKTLNGDSPSIGEIFILNAKTMDSDISLYEKFLNEPFRYIPDKITYNNIINQMQNDIEVQAYWQNDKYKDWQTSFNSKVKIICDGTRRYYQIPIDAGGTFISDYKIMSTKVPSLLNIWNFVVKY